MIGTSRWCCKVGLWLDTTILPSIKKLVSAPRWSNPLLLCYLSGQLSCVLEVQCNKITSHCRAASARLYNVTNGSISSIREVCDDRKAQCMSCHQSKSWCSFSLPTCLLSATSIFLLHSTTTWIPSTPTAFSWYLKFSQVHSKASKTWFTNI